MTLADTVLDELRPGLEPEVLAQIPSLSQQLVKARRVVCFGVGREGLMMKALAMRLYHLGLDVHLPGEMTTPPVGPGDVLFVSAGPGNFSTVAALVNVARDSGATTICITAELGGHVPRSTDEVIHLPAQTMAADQGAMKTSILPMGSLFEALMFLFFELLVLDMRDRLGISSEAMRSKHTNLE